MSIIPDNEKLTIGKYQSIGEAYENSMWFYKLVTGLCDYYGYPATQGECYSKNERIMYAWAIMNIVNCLREYKILWVDGVDKFDIDLLIESFVEAVYDLSGKAVIPPFGDAGGVIK